MPQQFQMPSYFDQQQQMQQMSAMMAMAAAAGVGAGAGPGMAGGMGAGAPFLPPGMASPQTAMMQTPSGDCSNAALFPPAVDPAMAYQMFTQYLQQAQAYASADTAGIGANIGVPPSPFAAMCPPYTSATHVMPVVSVSVDGMKFHYQLTEDDLLQVFSRYGTVKDIHVDEVGTTAQITFQEFHHAQAAMTDLNGKVLNGLDGTLRLVWANQGVPTPMPPPYPMMPPFPHWGFPAHGTPSWPSSTSPSVAPGAIPGATPHADWGFPAPGTSSWSAVGPAGGTSGAAIGGGTSQTADLANILVMGTLGAGPPASVDLNTAPDSDNTAVAGGGGGGSVAATAGHTDAKVTAAPAHVKGVRKYTCRFLIGIENDKEFQVVRRIIGAKGTNMKRIVRQTEAKLRLRGVGSGYFEGAGQRESSEPLQLCVSCTSSDGHRTAVRLVEELLENVYSEYRQFCRENGRPGPDLHAAPQLVSPGGRSGSGGGTGGGAGGGASDACAGGGSTGLPIVADSPANRGSLDVGGGSVSAGEGHSPSGKRDGRRRGRRSRAKKGDPGKTGVERGEPPPKAPPVDEIERLIDQRNEARRQCNFTEADRIRQSLHEKGVALMDEPGARGKGAEVTTWRYWRE